MPYSAVHHDAASGSLSTSSSPPSSSLRDPAAACARAISHGVASSTPDHVAAIAAPAPADSAAATAAVKKSSPTIATRPSLFSRLGLQLPLPLRSRNRNIADFHIRCDEPHKKYTAGDSVRGAVVLAVVKPLRITHLVVALHGYVRVLKDPTSVAKAQSVTILPPPGSSSRPQYQGNGLTSLFQDEQVLSGDGRIESGKYEFGFDLIFPDKWLPSSIDFERGTISYMITATLTRPVSMAPTSTCERKVTLVQQIDVGLLSPPRPRTIFLEPISKRTRRKKSVLNNDKTSGVAAQELNDLTSDAGSSIVTEDSARGEAASYAPSEARGSSVPSDMHSEFSGESARSASTTSRAEFAQPPHVGSTLTSAAKQQVVDDKTITATIELLKGGCLPGETVTVRVTVQHIKAVKSMNGVVVTLFRQSKIDTNPPASLSKPCGEGPPSAKRLTREDAYPKSRTGIGGLSFSSSSSTSVFRKDLDQNVAPLIIDPATLQASVTVSVRIPDDAFPTITGVPGDMISFKYQAEVIVDLAGRLTTQLTGGSSMTRVGTPGGNNGEQNQTPFGHQRGSNIADTSQVRGQKGVISVSLETVVGTLDSARLRQPAKSAAGRSRTIRIAETDKEKGRNDDAGDGRRHDYTVPPPHPADALQQRPWASTGISDGSLHVGGIHHYPPPPPPPLAPPPPPPPPLHTAPSYVPSPQVPDEAHMTEKEIIRQAETRLLPSQPPAGAPTDADEDDLYSAQDAFETRSSGPVVPSLDEAEAGPSAPSAPPADTAGASRPAGDKQELERQRLMEEASAPPEFPEDMEPPVAQASASASAHLAEATAPVLDEDDDTTDNYRGYGVAAGSSGGVGGSEQLPAYQR